MSLERIFQALVSLGLSEPDARVYMYLALKGPKETNGIISNLKINKQQIIQSLRNLQNKDIIVVDIEKHNTFSALPFEEALKLLIKTEKEQTKIKEENLLLNWKTMLKKNSSIVN